MPYEYIPYPYRPSEVIKVGKTKFKQPIKEEFGIRLSPEVESKITYLRKKQKEKSEISEINRINRKKKRKLRQDKKELDIKLYKIKNTDNLTKSETYRNYSGYLQTKKWARKRSRILRRDKNRCQACGSTRFLQIHHLSYINIYNERDDDLITVCDLCHTELHIYEKENGCSMNDAFEYVKQKYSNTNR